MSKSPINFNVGGLSQGIMGGMQQNNAVSGRNARKILRSNNKRIKNVEEMLGKITQEAESSAVPPEEGLDNTALESASEDQAIETPGMTNEASAEIPSAVEGLEEEAYATAGTSGLNMMKRIARR